MSRRQMFMARILALMFTALALLGLDSVSPALAGETVTYFHNDIAGTPLVATDEAGNVVWKESYRPYGERLVKEDDSGDNRVWFTGKPHDETTGLSYFGARYYDPVLGRFMGVDPKGVEPGDLHSFNRYAYANSNPHKFLDPDGRVPVLLIPLLWMGVGAAEGGAINAGLQYVMTGSVEWGGIGGVADAASDGMMLGPFAAAAARGSLPRVASGAPRSQATTENTAALQRAGSAYKHEYKYHPRVRQRGVEDPKAHSFPYSFDDEILQVKPIRQTDGSLLYRKPGSLHDKQGNYEIAVNPETETIFHRTFVGDK